MRIGGKTLCQISLAVSATTRGETVAIPCGSVDRLRFWKSMFDQRNIDYEICARISKGLSGEYGSRRRLTIYTRPKASNDNKD